MLEILLQICCNPKCNLFSFYHSNQMLTLEVAPSSLYLCPIDAAIAQLLWAIFIWNCLQSQFMRCFLKIYIYTLFFVFWFLFFLKKYLFIYFWLCWVFVSVRGLSLVAASRGHSSSRCAGLPLSRPLLLRSTGSRRAGSVVVAHGPSCSAACGDPPRPGLEPVSPALAGRFSTTAPPGKPVYVV